MSYLVTILSCSCTKILVNLFHGCRQFYGSQLNNGTDVEGWTTAYNTQPETGTFVVFDVEEGKEHFDGSSYINLPEAEAVVDKVVGKLWYVRTTTLTLFLYAPKQSMLTSQTVLQVQLNSMVSLPSSFGTAADLCYSSYRQVRPDLTVRRTPVLDWQAISTLML